VLVHGSWQGPLVWRAVAESLRQAGQVVQVVELPAHGADQTPPAAVTLNNYRDKVVGIIGATSGQVVLVGHSFGGMVASAVAEQIPDRIAKVVYLAGYVPTSGQSQLSLALSDTASRVLTALVPSADGLTLGIQQSQLVPIFCQDCSPTAGQLLIDSYRPEPSIPASNTVG